MELKSDENMQSFLNRLKTHTIETIDIGNLKEKFKSKSVLDKRIHNFVWLYPVLDQALDQVAVGDKKVNIWV